MPAALLCANGSRFSYCLLPFCLLLNTAKLWCGQKFLSINVTLHFKQAQMWPKLILFHNVGNWNFILEEFVKIRGWFSIRQQCCLCCFPQNTTPGCMPLYIGFHRPPLPWFLHVICQKWKASLSNTCNSTCISFRDENLSGSELTAKLEPAFLSGLRCAQPLIRAKFFEVFDNSMKRRVYERLLYVTCSQNWEAMGNHFWIKQCIEVGKWLFSEMPLEF